MKHVPAALIAALLASAAFAQFAPTPIVTTNIPDVDRHVAAAKVAAGSEWSGCTQPLAVMPSASLNPGPRAAMPRAGPVGGGEAEGALAAAAAAEGLLRLQRARPGMPSQSRCSTTSITSA